MREKNTLSRVALFPSPIGLLYLASDGAALTGLWIEGQKYFPDLSRLQAADGRAFPDLSRTQAENGDAAFPDPLRMARDWLAAYFTRTALPPMPPLAPAGTPFRRAVWARLRDIPYGETTTYGALAGSLREEGISASPRSVGGAVGRNPISILIPCHRVLGADGGLTGYAGGLPAKRYLLTLEGLPLPASSTERTLSVPLR